jgi:glycosyltransferase involved in cell wall biosynthesis
MTTKRLLSVIVPTFNQEKTIQEDIRNIINILEQIRYDYELIVVVDGMTDKTYEMAEHLENGKIKVVGYETNHGKGYAVRFGMARSKGDIVAFIDSGMELNPNGLSMLLEHFEWYEADIIVGSKRHPVSKVNYPLERKIISKLAQIFIKILFGVGVSDTQAGIKFFRRKVLEDVLPRLIVKKFAFDIEVLAVAQYLGYKRIFEAPIELNFQKVSSTVSLNLYKAVWYTFIDCLGIYYRIHLLHYYSDTNRRKWKYDPELNFRVNIP